jgi:hypothetical protein
MTRYKNIQTHIIINTVDIYPLFHYSRAYSTARRPAKQVRVKKQNNRKKATIQGGNSIQYVPIHQPWVCMYVCIVECWAVSRQRSQTNRFPRQQPACNSEGTVANCVFYGDPCRGIIRKTSGARTRSWKGVANQRGPEHGRRGTVTRQLLVNTMQTVC